MVIRIMVFWFRCQVIPESRGGSWEINLPAESESALRPTVTVGLIMAVPNGLSLPANSALILTRALPNLIRAKK